MLKGGLGGYLIVQTDEEKDWYHFEIRHREYRTNNKSAILLIYKEVQKVYNPFTFEMDKMINLTYVSNKGKEVKNSINIEVFRDMDMLLDSINTTMGAVI
jgi:hypothetical protein